MRKKGQIVNLPKVNDQTKGHSFNGSTTQSFPNRLISVTKRHVDEAIRKNSGHCMTAEAIKDAMPEARMVTVDIQTIRWSMPKLRLRYMALTPRAVQVAIINYDQGLIPAPFKFKIQKAQIAYMKGTRFDKVGKIVLANEKVPIRKRNEKYRARHIPKTSTLKIDPNGSAIKAVKLGGKMPPRLPPRMGLRRQFGLRAFTLGEGLPEDNK